MNFSLNPIKYEDVRSQIVNFLTDNSEFSGQFDFTSSNIGLLIDTMAYVTMLMSYQVSNTANNLFLDTTTIRKNALSIAKTMGYRPQRSISSKITGTVEYYDPNSSLIGCKIQIPAYTSFISDTGYVYFNFDMITLNCDPNDSHTLKSSITLYEGTLKTFSYLGSGKPFQTFVIPSSKVGENHFELSVRKNNETNFTVWNEVKDSFNLLDLNSYFLEEDINNLGYVKVVFGDRYITNYPQADEVVDIRYLETNAESANNSKIISSNYTNIVTSGDFVYNVDNFTPIVKTCSFSYGGTAIESIEVIKERAAKTFATVGRAVTQNDYKTLLGKNPYILKANSIGGDTLFPNDESKLGNIYLSAIPIIENMNQNFYNSNSIYLTTSNETDIFNTLDRYRIISTKLNFLKPSYISVDVTPFIEIKSSAGQIEIENIKTSVNTTLKNYAKSILDFAPTFRDSKVNGVVSDISGVVSSYFDSTYSFALTKETLYYPAIQNNMIFLPVIIQERDIYGDVSRHTNFVRTNKEQEELLNITAPDVLAIKDRTIFGQIKTPNNERYIYNEDSHDNVEICDLLIDGKNNFFDMYRFEDLSKNTIRNESAADPTTKNQPKVFTWADGTTTSLDVKLEYSETDRDSYVIKLNDPDPVFGLTEIGTIKRTTNMNYGFKGLVDREINMTSTTDGDFYKATISFPVTGEDKDFTQVYKDDVLIYSEAYGKWIKCVDKGNITAADDSGLFNNIIQNSMYKIGAEASIGDFNGKTPMVTAGDEIIFNIRSENQYYWDKVNHSTYTFDASTPIVKAAIPYEIKKVINLDLGTTTFDGRTNNVLNFVDEDLIYYNPNDDKWELLCNTSITGNVSLLPVIEGTPVSGGSLPAPETVLVGSAFIVMNIGDFGTDSVNVNWPNPQEEIAYEGDVLLYIGNGKWNIWQESQPDAFNIDGTVISALPIKLTYGDLFVIDTAGDFNKTEYGTVTYNSGDKIIYTKDNNWIQYIVTETEVPLNPLNEDTLPKPELKDTNIGDIHTVIADGNFNNSYMIQPLNDTFIQGDTLIFNGSFYTKLNEYTFEYAPIEKWVTTFINGIETQYYVATGREYLNYLQFNSVFHYTYDFNSKYYKFYFNDMYHGSKIGSFRYTGIPSINVNLYDVGKISFESYIIQNFDYNHIFKNYDIRTIFDDTTINKITFLPKKKRDQNGNITMKDETDFVTNFNSFIIINANTTQVI